MTKTERILNAARRAGARASYSVASTGSRYITISAEDCAELVVRVADHGECYCREDIDVSPTGASATDACAQIRTWAAEHGCTPMPRAPRSKPGVTLCATCGRPLLRTEAGWSCPENGCMDM